MTPSPSTRRRLVDCLSQVDPRAADESILVLSVHDSKDSDALTYLRCSWVGFEPFQDHPLYRSGIYRCEIDKDGETACSANGQKMLRFHSDMALTPLPPEITFIRCVEHETSPGSGENLFIHMTDVIHRLHECRRGDLVDMLTNPRSIVLADGSSLDAAMVVNPLGSAALRVFDRIGWQSSAKERAQIDELLDLCEEWQDLHVRVALDPGAAVVFSNRHFIHARTACLSTTRIVEICLGSIRGR